MRKESDLLLAKQLGKMITKKTKKNGLVVMLDGMMALGMKEDGLRSLDFQCCEDVEAETFVGNFKVQAMRDGNVYMEEKPKRVKNKPIFREDNSSLSLGRDGRYYFYFSLPKELVDELPMELVRQAYAISRKVIENILTD